MQRRGFLKSLAGSGLLIGLGLPALGYERRKPTVIVITDINPDTPVSRLRSMLGAMLAKGLPVTCIVHARGQGGDLLRSDSALAGLLREYMVTYPGLLEIAGHVRDLAAMTEHFQAREAYRARRELVEALVPETGLDGTGPLLQSLACDHVDQPKSPTGARSAGVRNVLVLPKASGLVQTEAWENGVLRVFGGVRADLFAAIENLGLLAPKQFQNVILLSVRENSTKSEHLIAAAATVFANVALQHEADQWISNLRLCDLQMRDGYFKFERRVGLHLFRPDDGSVELISGFNAFRSELSAAGLAFSTGPGGPGLVGMTARQGYWVATEDADANLPQTVQESAETLVGLDCGLSPAPLLPGSGRFLPAGVGLALNPRPGGIQGLDDCGRLQIPVLTVSTRQNLQPRLLSGADNTNDLIVAISPDILATRANRNALRGEIDRLTDDWVTRIVPIGDMARPIVPANPLISLYRHTEAYIPRIEPDPVELSDQERQRLLEDAVMAWSYFYRLTDKRTGLCPATVLYVNGEKSGLKSATMWDISSHINALIAAVDLDILSETEFREGIAKILYNLHGRKTDGRMLPSEWIKTNRSRTGNKNFDGCDAGRLLASLWNLSRHRYGDGKPAELVKNWDLDKIIVDRKIQSVKEGSLVSTYESHCAHYAARAFRAWGFDVASPYEVMGDGPVGDSRMALLAAAAEIGPIGAEPLLLEAMDFGLSPESAYLADVLFGAQLREFETTGNLVCASEGPIDKAPWFTYQGLQFDAPDRTWVIDTVRDDPKFLTPEFQSENRVISSKAAFLWRAQVPHGFSDTLLDHVRNHARTTIGFASSIYSATGKATRNYSDINTNGIILQAVARILNGGGKAS